MKHYEVVAAIIVNNGEYLCLQRGEGKYSYISNKFEFPGGKLEQGESQNNALKRELMEELSLDVEESAMTYLLTTKHAYPDFHLTMHCYYIEIEHRNITRNEHISEKWLAKEILHQLDWAEADIPIMQYLQSK